MHFATLATLTALVGTSVADTWGGSVSLGPSKSTIIKAVTTLIPGAAPPTQNGMLFLWPGMSNGTGDLVQTTLEAWPDNSWCGAKKGEWCITYTLLSDNDTWRQDVTDADTGKQLSVFEHKSGPFMRGYGTGTECNGGCSPTVSEQRYLNTEITLAAADPNFGKTIATAQKATYKGLTSTNGGKVWKISEIRVPAMV
ncbi:uncharacterized protein NECHADRAFT_105885 [Fusarium vanettenii 77-13-4]|uniref:Uncharacterized protein n=1 Tax=Fusarium vanettenii (strain ATCC MYA-4622 / CBS 123669 / FGSC 9596 / NRRL 45880 / 77-13-4) TaxID=660122 RepID=C7Z6F0_FUSV7|nr:uncharacterized protein NECHADRAFT_105885 [Fusarium vanettenii 77-13-4]EEU40120.1 hypothetical protein NECHADRAFT_105885 [Fusarium vanettenii 77-13-4]